MKLIGTAIDQKQTGEDAMWKERRNHHIMISKQQLKELTFTQQLKEWLATNADGKLPTNQQIEG
jgi:hypothetical protein